MLNIELKNANASKLILKYTYCDVNCFLHLIVAIAELGLDSFNAKTSTCDQDIAIFIVNILANNTIIRETHF